MIPFQPQTEFAVVREFPSVIQYQRLVPPQEVSAFFVSWFMSQNHVRHGGCQTGDKIRATFRTELLFVFRVQNLNSDCAWTTGNPEVICRVQFAVGRPLVPDPFRFRKYAAQRLDSTFVSAPARFR